MAVAVVLSQVDIQTTGAYQTIYSPTASTIFNGLLKLVAQNTSGATVKVAVKAGATPTDAANMIHYKVMTQFDVVEVSNISLNASSTIYVESNTADVTATIMGTEEDV